MSFGGARQGRPGKSAYQIAVSNGFEGTEVEWLSSLHATGTAVSTYTHTQGTPSTTWTINHNLGFRPLIQVFSSGGLEVEAEVLHTSINQTVVYFNNAFAGTARLT